MHISSTHSKHSRDSGETAAVVAASFQRMAGHCHHVPQLHVSGRVQASTKAPPTAVIWKCRAKGHSCTHGLAGAATATCSSSTGSNSSCRMGTTTSSTSHQVPRCSTRHHMISC